MIRPERDRAEAGRQVAYGDRHRLLGGGRAREDGLAREVRVHRVPVGIVRDQDRPDDGRVAAGGGRQAQRPVAGERVQGPQRRFCVRRLHERAKGVPGILHRARLGAQMPPLRLGQAQRIVVGHFEAAGQLHERCHATDVVQRHPVVPCLRGPGHLRRVLRDALDQRHALVRLLTADRPLPFEHP